MGGHAGFPGPEAEQKPNSTVCSRVPASPPHPTELSRKDSTHGLLALRTREGPVVSFLPAAPPIGTFEDEISRLRGAARPWSLCSGLQASIGQSAGPLGSSFFAHSFLVMRLAQEMLPGKSCFPSPCLSLDLGKGSRRASGGDTYQ